MAVRELVSVHVGQAGCSAGRSVWELLCKEHDIMPNGLRQDDDSFGAAEDPFNAFFSETSSGQHVPRAVFMDTDPASKENILKSEYKQLFHTDSLLAYKQDCKGNYFEGRSAATQYYIVEEVVDRVRLAVDKCNNLQGFFVYRSFGGGTGAGIGSEIIHQLHETFSKKLIFEPAIYPSVKYATSALEPYNCILATADTRDVCHLSMMLDNQAAYRICTDQLKVPNPSYIHLNRLIAQMVSACTTSLRFDSELSASLAEMVTNMVPVAPFRYVTTALSPIRHPSRAKHEANSVAEVIADLFDKANVMCEAPNLQANRYLAATLLLRGHDDQAKVISDSVSQASGASGKGGLAAPIQVNSVLSAIDRIMSPPGGSASRLKFLPWLQSGGFKVGVVGVPPTVPDPTFMAAVERQGACLANTTAVRSVFLRQYEKYCRLMFHRAYQWQFISANGETEMFYEAKEKVRDILDAYEELLIKCQTAENESSARNLQLVGRTVDARAAAGGN